MMHEDQYGELDSTPDASDDHSRIDETDWYLSDDGEARRRFLKHALMAGGGLAAVAVANAVYHATGVRVRNLPITPDKLLGLGGANERTASRS